MFSGFSRFWENTQNNLHLPCQIYNLESSLVLFNVILLMSLWICTLFECLLKFCVSAQWPSVVSSGTNCSVLCTVSSYNWGQGRQILICEEWGWSLHSFGRQSSAAGWICCLLMANCNCPGCSYKVSLFNGLHFMDNCWKRMEEWSIEITSSLFLPGRRTWHCQWGTFYGFVYITTPLFHIQGSSFIIPSEVCYWSWDLNSLLC